MFRALSPQACFSTILRKYSSMQVYLGNYLLTENWFGADINI
jgi:hypothetical protein